MWCVRARTTHNNTSEVARRHEQTPTLSFHLIQVLYLVLVPHLGAGHSFPRVLFEEFVIPSRSVIPT